MADTEQNDKLIVNVEFFTEAKSAFEELKIKLGLVNNNDVIRYAVIFANKRTKK